MRKRKSVKRSEDESEGSEVVDEPEEFQDSGDDWTPAAEPQNAQPPVATKKRVSGPSSAKKKRKGSSSEESEGEGGEGEGEGEGEGDEGMDSEDESDEDKNGSDGNKSEDGQNKDVPKYYHSGNFVLLKNDVKWEGEKVTSKLNDLYLWKIDGKALLQKYIPVESSGKVVHKCTCVYSGWNVDNRENYYPISDILDKNPKTDIKEPCVSLNLDDLIKIKDKQ